jgi:RNA polymerase sigma factor (sigma-70 family)
MTLDKEKSGLNRHMSRMRKGATSSEIEEIYRERFRAFLLSATALLRDGDAALDAVQDGFAVALRRRRSFRRDGTLEAWLWRIVLNAARDQRRRRRREAVLERVETSNDEAYSWDGMRAALLTLPERQRIVVFLRYYADLPYDRIAEILGVSTGTVAASLNAARSALRRDFEEVQK